jgi:hypothetical protein
MQQLRQQVAPYNPDYFHSRRRRNCKSSKSMDKLEEDDDDGGAWTVKVNDWVE